MEINAGTFHQSFNNRFSSEQDCMDALIAMKWPNGFVCPRCAYTRCSRLTSRRIPLFECESCGHQTSPLVGTIFEGTHLPLLKWFQALELFLHPDGISAMRLSQVIRVTYKTAWLMLHKIRYALGEFDASELLSGDVKVNCDQYGTPPSRRPSLDRHTSAVVAGCTVTESGEVAQVKIRLVPHKPGNGKRANRHELAAFISREVDACTSAVESFPLAYRLYWPLRKVVHEAWESLVSTYVALGQKHLQAYLNEYTVRRRLRLPGAIATMRRELLRICMATPRIPYRRLIQRQSHLLLSPAA
ncbi:transposase [Paenibacillus timonensis]|uniref:Transposase n=1 Tax=Paenibacillus timonensis TaxID=225915 RepID=A0ABW3SGV0_9BACL|nr:transposase [Paenibacillus timonensis]MCH1642424.1 transposase [Paenibacillus timonensis]